MNSILHSDYKVLCPVTLPFKNRQKYMHTFDLANPKMPEGFEDYASAVIALCNAAGATVGLAHMTVDEKTIASGMSQRRPKPHVDGCFTPNEGKWTHGGEGGWSHGGNNIPLSEFQRMAVIVVSSAIGCRAWKGQFEGQPKEDGDLSHLVLNEGEILEANVGYLFSPDCIHESMIQEREIQRSFLRIALPANFKGV